MPHPTSDKVASQANCICLPLGLHPSTTRPSGDQLCKKAAVCTAHHASEHGACMHEQYCAFKVLRSGCRQCRQHRYHRFLQRLSIARYRPQLHIIHAFTYPLDHSFLSIHSLFKLFPVFTVVATLRTKSGQHLRATAKHCSTLTSTKHNLASHTYLQHCNSTKKSRSCAPTSATWHGSGAQPPRNLFEDVYHQRARSSIVPLHHFVSCYFHSTNSSEYYEHHKHHVYAIRIQECCVLCELGSFIHQV